MCAVSPKGVPSGASEDFASRTRPVQAGMRSIHQYGVSTHLGGVVLQPAICILFGGILPERSAVHSVRSLSLTQEFTTTYRFSVGCDSYFLAGRGKSCRHTRDREKRAEYGKNQRKSAHGECPQAERYAPGAGSAQMESVCRRAGRSADSGTKWSIPP